MRELKEFNSYSFSEDQVKVSMVDDNPFELMITLTPNDGLYKDGFYEVKMNLSKQYPSEKPRLTFWNKIFHPNVAGTSICFSLLSEENEYLRITDYAHGMLWFLYHPNLLSPMNCDCPREPNKFALLVRQSIVGGVVCGYQYPRSQILPPLKKNEVVLVAEGASHLLTNEKKGKVWVWECDTGGEW
eukprot:CAMPEP_0201484316 /NCGR_PEP_ID=MMETSP0151_2-20130828/8513_1 /ASSEMBLY_ACC=CAM_ASM_000257 /TAXON_ID=200890 /ORGANISM="Paramoeba atlantica, Strain 621/1 / CCAP 1560/9" /LENGTH=185 /DNA_ID=CAMNT_0047867929 /DNA_START=149 /DNA_END=703 /DNA_ORIENTATION=+